jgi:hypothetical protein
MDIWIIIAFAVGFTLLTMLMGPWMWSSSWTNWRWYGGKDAGTAPKEDPAKGAAEAPRQEDPAQRK